MQTSGITKENERILDRATPKDEPRWGEKEFEQNNVRENVLEYPQKNVHFKTKSNPDPQ